MVAVVAITGLSRLEMYQFYENLPLVTVHNTWSYLQHVLKMVTLTTFGQLKTVISNHLFLQFFVLFLVC